MILPILRNAVWSKSIEQEKKQFEFEQEQERGTTPPTQKQSNPDKPETSSHLFN